MKETTENLHFLRRLTDKNSLCPVEGAHFPVNVTKDYIPKSSALEILNRAERLYEYMVEAKEIICELYTTAPTERLMNNFGQIIGYSDRVISQSHSEAFDDYFFKLENFCGQIENIMKMIRYYNNIFSK